ncbi:hypothetical protein LCGC14_0729070 [marine sediment metagenome]|uniref:Uncharacterized protein n=1 Tax=marine sediment metagenome TaxID=412755 RepID=A0A0F9QAA1_9ZZZZ
MRLYLAHNYGTRHLVKNLIQPMWEKDFDVELLNPFASRPELYDIVDSSEKYAKHINEQLGGATAREIVEMDLRNIRESDGLIAYMKNVSIGTNMEIFYNAYILNKPTIAIVHEEDLLHHVWLRELANPVMYDDLTKYTFDKVFRSE